MLKLNMGSGENHIEGLISVDKLPLPGVSIVLDIEHDAWPWEDSSVDEVLFNHSLEHMGGHPDDFINIMRSLYRVCCDGAIVHVHVPHPRHDYYLGDPTHVRPILPATFEMFSRQQNLKVRELGGANSLMALWHHVDFELIRTDYVLDEEFAYLQADNAWKRMMRTMNNVIKELKMQLRVIK